MFSKATEHGIKAVSFIALQSFNNVKVKVQDVSEEIESPAAYTAKILQELVRHGIIDSKKGPFGGFYIDQNRLETLKLVDIVFALDGDNIYKGCGLGLKECSSESPCPMHFKFVAIRTELKKMLEETSLLEIALGLKSESSVLK